MKFLPATFLLSIALVSAPLGGAGADASKQVPMSNGEVTLSFAPVVKKAAPAVVNVYASRTEKVQRNPLFDDPVFRQFFGGGGNAGPRSETTRSLGSGVLVDASGLVVTNYHVIDQMTDVKVALSDQSEYPAEIVLRDQRNDLAVLRIKGDGPFPVMEMGDSDNVEVGDIALAIGDPFGVGQTVTQGIISALARTNVGQGVSSFYLQTDASINPGNSGGRWSIRTRDSSASIRRSSRNPAGRSASASPSRSTWSKSSSPRPRPATSWCIGPGSARACKR